ncbi:MAG: aryl-sulfate sulfotransferase [Bacilli bacterium]|nr:aryl-sulfate sulfotransferase [Bacilli bacterium]
MARYIRIIIILILVVFLAVFSYIKLSNNTIVDEEQLNEDMKLELKDDIYYVNYNYGSDIYSTEYRDIISKKINELKEKKNTLLIYNAYGTNDLSVNLYLKTKKYSYISYTISVDDEDIDDFTNTWKNISKNHKYQIIGLVPGYINNIKVTLFDENDDTISKTNYEIDLTNLKKYSSKLDIYAGKDIYISDGLFTVFSKDNIYFYDNKGIIRSHILLDDYSAKDILFKDNYMYYPIDKNNIVKVNRLGEIKDIYYTKYDISTDYIIDNNRILYIGNDNKYDTINDQIISINLSNHDVTKLIDGTELFSKYKENNNSKYYLNLVSIDSIDGDIVLSSKQTSSIIRINDIYKKPYIKYILGNKKLWDKEYYKYIYNYKDNLFFGQSEVKVNGNYITMLNNNYVSESNYNSKKDIYDELKVKNTDKKTGTKSLFYKLKVNDKKKSYKLIESNVVPYTSTNGSLQRYKGNYIFNSSINNTYIEYNKKFEIVNSYKTNFNINKVYKYDFKKYWFK